MRYSWKMLHEQVGGCVGCGLCEHRTHAVLGEGDIHAPVMLIGEGPGREEDLSGRPFVGPAGQLLDRMLGAVELKREDVYIANVVKCRPPANRTPTEAEAQACLPYLRAQFALVSPKIIVCLGATAARCVYGADVRITRDRGQWKQSKGVWLLPTYHPAALLRDESKKRDAWADMQALRKKILELGCDKPSGVIT